MVDGSRSRGADALRQGEFSAGFKQSQLASATTLAPASNVLFWDWDLSSGLMTWSGAIDRMFEISAPEVTITRHEWETRIHPDDGDSLKGPIQDVIAGKIVHADLSYSVRRPDGSYERVLDRVFLAPYADDSGKLIGTLNIIGERPNHSDAMTGSMIERLQASEDRFRNFVEFLPLLAWEADADGWLIFYNQRWYEYSGTTPEQMEGWGWISVHDPDDLARMLKVFRQAIYTGRPWEDEFKLRRADGSFRWHLSRAMPVRDEQGRVVRWFGTNTDIHDQKMALVEREQLLRAEKRLREEAEKTSHEKDEFLAMLSHELRSPLSAIFGWTELLKRQTTEDPQLAPMVAKIKSNALVLTRLIDDLLDVSRIISGKMEIEKSPIDVTDPLRAAIDGARTAAQEKVIEISTHWPQETAQVLASTERLQQVFANLLSNAVKFSPSGTRIVINLEVTEGWVTVTVTDEGEGIDPAFLPRLFTKFSQADTSTKRRHGGLGLGLSIAHHLVEILGGTIHAHSDGIRRGATFTVRLPKAGTSPVAKSRQTANQLDANIALNGIKILAVDDDPEARDVIVSMLVNCGATVTMVNSVAEALSALRVGLPDVIVSDLSMPEVDGYGLIERLRSASDPALHEIPVIALTALASEQDRARALARGFSAFVAKPFTPAALSRAIMDLVRLCALSA
ncbi:MAG: PAS domain-containing protein [Deltaproteobacteria bacterium]|nr:PAS domain-containing protein [Deltaproteobacteria bacterium]